MSNREYIDERHYRIKHVRDLGNGKTEEFYREYVDYTTDTHTYLSPEFEKMDVASHNGGNSTSVSTYKDGKAADGTIIGFEESVGGKFTQVKKMEIIRTSGSVTFRYTRMDDTTFEHVHPWPLKRK